MKRYTGQRLPHSPHPPSSRQLDKSSNDCIYCAALCRMVFVYCTEQLVGTDKSNNPASIILKILSPSRVYQRHLYNYTEKQRSLIVLQIFFLI